MRKYFLGRHMASRMTGDALVHAFSGTEQYEAQGGLQKGWAPFCAQTLLHYTLPGRSAGLADVTCVRCMAELMR